MITYHAVGSKNVWPEFEIIIEEESEYNTDIPEDNALSNSLISRNKVDETMNSLMDNFQVLSPVVFHHWDYIAYLSMLFANYIVCEQGDDDKKSWAYFQERIAKAPEQVLRWLIFSKFRMLN